MSGPSFLSEVRFGALLQYSPRGKTAMYANPDPTNTPPGLAALVAAMCVKSPSVVSPEAGVLHSPKTGKTVSSL